VIYFNVGYDHGPIYSLHPYISLSIVAASPSNPQHLIT